MSLPTAHDTSPTLDAAVVAALRSRPREEASPVRDWSAASVVGTRGGANQDRWGQRDERLFVLADGMGGHADGAMAAEVTVASVLAATGCGQTWRQRVSDADAAVRAQGGGAGASGTTLVAVDYDQGRATVVGVGDSRVYRWRDGLEQLTQDHTVRGALLTAGIDADQHGAGREARGLTSYVGIGPERLRVDVVDVPVRTGDRLLLCSDGVYGGRSMAAIADALSAPSCRDAVAALLAPAGTAARRDDATAIVIELA